MRKLVCYIFLVFDLTAKVKVEQWPLLNVAYASYSY